MKRRGDTGKAGRSFRPGNTTAFMTAAGLLLAALCFFVLSAAGIRVFGIEALAAENGRTAEESAESERTEKAPDKEIGTAVLGNSSFSAVSVSDFRGTVTVRSGKNYTVYYEGETALQPLLAEEGKLITISRIREEKEQTETAPAEDGGGNLTITVPTGVKLESLIVQSEGTVVVTDVTVGTMNIHIQDGGVPGVKQESSAKQSNAKQNEAKQRAAKQSETKQSGSNRSETDRTGKLVLKGVSLGTGELCVDNGDIRMNGGSFRNLTLECGCGSVSLSAAEGLARSRVSASVQTGTVTAYGSAKGKAFRQSGNGRKSLTINVGEGNIVVMQ